jgi:carbamoyltransferase
MRILGFNGGMAFESEFDDSGISHHDSAAVLLEDGQIIAAVEEERLSRLKHSNCFPMHAIRYCLSAADCELQDVDLIATNNAEYTYDATAKLHLINNASAPIYSTGRLYLSSRFERVFGVDIADKLHFCNHHVAHAWSAFGLSGFDRSLVVSIDGDGDNSSGLILDASNGCLQKLRDLPVDLSLGRMYEALIRLLGFSYFDEYKAMGLAPYGDPAKFRPLFEKCYSLLPEGRYRLEPMSTWLAHLEQAGLVEQARRQGRDFTQVHADFAATLQESLETIALHMLQYFQKITAHRNLCLAGGVGHNCSLNGRILESGLFDEVFVQPAAHDAGGALGAAISAYLDRVPARVIPPMTHLYFGPHAGSKSQVENALARWSSFLDYRRESEIEKTTAAELAKGAVIGWVQGRAEFGPRALGNRSILADPRPPQNKLRINDMVKKRESFRPFAPSVLEEAASKYFHVEGGAEHLAFMIFVVDVQEEFREHLGAITHVDGTARIQTVRREENPKYWRLICEFGRLTGVPILLNTSFNNNAEPIVTSIDDAVACFLTTGLDLLVIDNYIAVKKDPAVIRDAISSLRPKIPPFLRLTKRHDSLDGLHPIYEIESLKDKGFGFPVIPLSRSAYGLLNQADGTLTVSELLDSLEVETAAKQTIQTELISLWTRRAISFEP